MSSLIIIANPNKDSFTHAMATSYIKGHPDCTIIDLYDENINFLRNKGEKLSSYQKLIQTHDELAFFFPVWRGNVPAILKNFFDTQLSSGFAFEYVSGKSLPNKLLKGKTAKIFATCDAPSIVYRLPLFGINIGRYLRHAILGFCGIKITKYKLFGNLHKKSHKQRKNILSLITRS